MRDPSRWRSQPRSRRRGRSAWEIGSTRTRRISPGGRRSSGARLCSSLGTCGAAFAQDEGCTKVTTQVARDSRPRHRRLEDAGGRRRPAATLRRDRRGQRSHRRRRQALRDPIRDAASGRMERAVPRSGQRRRRRRGCACDLAIRPKALASGGVPALARGFAVMSSDAGHSGADPANKALGLAAGAAFGLDPQARRDYGYSADMTLAPIAKAIIAAHYGRKPDFSYMFGCSNGGRHTMVAATRMPEAYDGFLVGDPGFDLPRAAIQHAWDAQAFVKADPDIRKSITADDAALVSRKIIAACDKLDGLEDGLTANLAACQKAFDFDSLVCAPGASCGLPAQGQGRGARRRASPDRRTRRARRSIPTGRSTAASAQATGGCGRSKARSRPGTTIRSSRRWARPRSNISSPPRRRRSPARPTR